MKLNTTTGLKDFAGEPLVLDLTLKDMVNVLNTVIEVAAKENAGLGERLEKIAHEVIEAVKKPMTLRDVIFIAANTPQPGIGTNGQARIFKLAVRSMEADEIEAEAEDLAALKAGISAVISNPLIGRQAARLLEGKDPFATEE